MAGRLIECGAQITGGYFADPGLEDVSDLHLVGFPIVEVAADGSFVVGKADATGGVVDCRTVKEQLLYEVHDPAAYLTPDVVADISEAEVEEVGPNRVGVRGDFGGKTSTTITTIPVSRDWCAARAIGDFLPRRGTCRTVFNPLTCR